jgi:ubiquinone/menaquinone biosynthesis C-methylase UbiE
MNLATDFYRREERLRRTTRELLRVPGALLLDVGCRKGELTRLLATDDRHVVAVDIDRFDQWLEGAPRIRFIQADAMALPFEDQCFDLVVSGECLQYVSDWRRALDEFHRVLKPQGRLVLSCPNGSLLIDSLDPYNLIHWFKKLVKPSAVRNRSMVKHVRARQMLSHQTEAWTCEVFLRRGSLAFIYSSCLVDNLQKWRSRLSGQFRTRSLIAERLLKPLIRLLFWVMKRDFDLSLRSLSYNAVYRFRKK